ncbi:hypothetical protein DLJ53_30500 [Acuticoccus sediminis]|uniref:ABC transporter domain-containing protein n=1 Tax=Acuticoccus sediminis TaxID=2184697 RepID=A0A8B2NLK5_9HYPH|nr:ATP-binding cassette domain-containing protein [Acuticoccus sediminis]RAH97008.1 hypothetical protein DLJ53_30500 [Acuticoccus sediminis]
MAETNVVSFDEAARARDERISYISDEDLQAAQSFIDADECHVAIDRCTVIMKSKTSRYAVFKDLTATFPKQRRIAVLGHKGSGKTVMIDVMLKRRSVHTGRVVVNSRLSWAVSYSGFLDQKLTLRQNLLFVARVLHVDPTYLMGATCEICNFQQSQLHERVKSLPAIMKRRIGLMLFLIADFDCHIIDGPLRAAMFGKPNERLEAMLAAVTARDYIATVTDPRQIPGNCDLAYILYNGRLFQFEDVAKAIEMYLVLPVPENPNPFAGQDDKDDDSDDESVAVDVM